jgi:O-antigen/teichoic acid export membrane protein
MINLLRIIILKRKNYFQVFISNLLNAIAHWFLLFIVAKKYGTEEMGIYSIGLGTILPFYSFFQLQLRNILITYGGSFSIYFTIRIFSVIIFLTGCFFLSVFVYPEYKYIFITISLFKSFEMISDLVYGYYQKINDHKYYSKQLIIRSLLMITFIMIGFFFENLNFLYFLFFVFTTYLIILIADLIFINRKEEQLFRFSIESKKALNLGFLGGIATFFIYFNSNIPRFFLEQFNDIIGLGIFSGIVYLIVTGRVIVQAIMQISLPNTVNSLKENDYISIQKRMKKEIKIISIISLFQFMIVPFSDLLLPLIYNSDFKNQKLNLSLVLLGAYFIYLTFSINNVVNALNAYKEVLIINLIVFVVSAVLNFLLIEKFGVLGAAIVFLLISFVQFSLTYLVVIQKLRNAKNA